MQFSCALSLNQHSHILWYVLVSGSYIFFALLPREYGASTRTHQQGDNELMSVLTIDALAEINGTLIECRGDSPTNPPIYSSAVLSVQGGCSMYWHLQNNHKFALLRSGACQH